MEILVSVIVPIYNTEGYLHECIDSILQQTYKNIQVILVDDGSTDGSLEICKAYMEKDERIMLIQKAHSGLVEARKAGVGQARGEYCIFVDSDDWIAENLLESVLPLTDNGSVDIVNYNIERVDGKERVKWIHTVADGVYECGQLEDIYSKMMFDFENSMSGISPSLCSKLIKKSVLEESIKNVDSRITLGEDAAVVYKAMLAAEKVAVTNESYYFYRTHGNSMTACKNIDIFCKIFYFQQYMQEMFSECDKKYKFEEQLKEYIIVCFLEKGIRDNFSINIRSLYNIPLDILRKLNGKIVLYGAGIVGKDYYRQLKQISDIEISAWVDKVPGNVCGYEVQSPETLKNIEFDQILIAVANEKTADEIKMNLEEYVSGKKIFWEKPVKLEKVREWII